MLGLDVAKQTAEQFAARALVLQLRTGPLGRRLPPIPADVLPGSYFCKTVHLLDLATPVIRAGLACTLAHDAEVAESPLGVLVAGVRAEPAIDPVQTTKLAVYHSLIAELIMRAHQAESRTAPGGGRRALAARAPRARRPRRRAAPASFTPQI